jgi:hypothetical protein
MRRAYVAKAQPVRRGQSSRRGLPRPVEAERDEPEPQDEPPPPAEPPRRRAATVAPARAEPDDGGAESGTPGEEGAPEEAENLFDVDEGKGRSARTVDATARFTKRRKEDPRSWEKGLELSAGLMLVSRSFDFNDPIQPASPNNYRSGMVPALLVEGAAYPLVFIGRGPLANLGVTASYYRVLSLKSQPPGASTPSATTLHQVEAGLLYRWNILGRATSPTLKAGASFGRLGFVIHWDESTPPAQYTLPDVVYLYLKLNLVQLEVPFYHSRRFSIGATVKFDYIHVFSAGDIEKSDPGGFGRSTTLGVDIGGGLWATFSGVFVRVSGFYRRIGFAFDQSCYSQQTGCYAAGGALDVYGGLSFLGGYAF